MVQTANLKARFGVKRSDKIKNKRTCVSNDFWPYLNLQTVLKNYIVRPHTPNLEGILTISGNFLIRTSYDSISLNVYAI